MEKKKRKKRSKKWKSIGEIPPKILRMVKGGSRGLFADDEKDQPVNAAASVPALKRYRVEKWRQFHPPNPAMLRHTLAFEGYTVYQWSDRPGSFYGMHKHPADQSHWVVAGSLEINIEGGGTYILEQGDRDFMPANTYHSARVIGDEPVVYLVGEAKE
jgi:quercetin dioxygenase-like cupin family protein